MELCIERETASWWETRWEQAGLPGLEAPTFEKLEAPADLGSWVCPATVLAWVAHEVEMEEGSAFGVADGMEQLSAHERKLMLCVLAYAYARQLFDAGEIARACATDPALRRLWGGGAPFPVELERFRRNNRAELQKILARVFLRAIRYQFDLGAVPLPVELEGDLLRLAAERVDIARHMEAVES